MAYIGQSPAIGNFVKLDDISDQFNSSLSTFATEVSGQPYTITNPYASIVVAGGQVLEPEVDYNFNNATIVFSTAPTSAWLNDFHIIALGEVLNSGIPSDNTVNNSKITNSTLQYEKFSAVLKARLLADNIIFGT